MTTKTDQKPANDLSLKALQERVERLRSSRYYFLAGLPVIEDPTGGLFVRRMDMLSWLGKRSGPL